MSNLALARRVDHGANLVGEAWALQARGDIKSAIESLRQALTRQPKRFDALSAIGAMLLEQGQTDEALKRLELACSVWPGNADAQSNRGLALLRLGKIPQALVAYEAALNLKADSLHGLIGKGVCLRHLARFAEAEPLLMQAIRLRPDRIEAMLELGALNEAWQRPLNAHAAFNMAAHVAPRSAEALSGRGRALFQLVSYEAAIADYDRALSLDISVEMRSTLICERARAAFTLGRIEEALQACREAVEMAPHLVAPLDRLSLLLFDLGRADEARIEIEKALLIDPRQTRLYHQLSAVKRFTRDDPQLQVMERLADEIAPGGEDEIELRFALGKARGDIGDFPGAFANWQRGNRLVRERRGYDEAASLGSLTLIQELCGRDFFASRSHTVSQQAAPIFIVGLPRSGSSLIEQIIASHPDVFGAGETDDFANVINRIELDGAGNFRFPEQIELLQAPHFAAIGAEYLRVVEARQPGAKRVVDKTLTNSRYIGLLHLAFPNARFIHSRRNPVECCFSCFSLNFEGSYPYTHDLGELGRYFRAHEALMAHWRDVLPPGVMIDVDLESVVTDLEGQARRLLEHCGLDWDPRCLAFNENNRPVRTASALQVREPVKRRDRPAWRDYEEFLQPLMRALETAPI